MEIHLKGGFQCRMLCAQNWWFLSFVPCARSTKSRIDFTFCDRFFEQPIKLQKIVERATFCTEWKSSLRFFNDDINLPWYCICEKRVLLYLGTRFYFGCYILLKIFLRLLHAVKFLQILDSYNTLRVCHPIFHHPDQNISWKKNERTRNSWILPLLTKVIYKTFDNCFLGWLNWSCCTLISFFSLRKTWGQSILRFC